MPRKPIATTFERRMVAALERVIEQRDQRNRELRWLMSHDGPNSGRGQVIRAASSVNATTILASSRPRIADSHDARPVKGYKTRSSARPYSRRQQAKDVARQYPNRRQSGDCMTFRVPSWYLVALDEAGITGQARVEALAGFLRHPFNEPAREPRKPRKPRNVSHKDERAARMRQAAGTIRMGDQD